MNGQRQNMTSRERALLIVKLASILVWQIVIFLPLLFWNLISELLKKIIIGICVTTISGYLFISFVYYYFVIGNSKDAIIQTFKNILELILSVWN